MNGPSVTASLTGATGFIGRHLAAELVRCGWQVRALVRHSARVRALPAEVTRILGDLGDQAALQEATHGVEVVYHLGAPVTGPWEVHHAVTVEGTRRLLEASRVAKVRRFVLVSSLVVYDKRHIRPGTPITEDWPLAPLDAADPYARGKMAAEALVCEAATAGLETVIVRPGLTYGPGRTIFPHLGVVAGNRFVAVGGADLLLPLVHVDSLVDALIKLGNNPAAAGKIYHVVDEGQITRGQYLRILEDLSRHRYRSVYVPAAPVAAVCAAVAAARRLTGTSRLPLVSAQKIRMRSVEARYDTSRLRSDTGWRPLAPVREGLARSLGVASDGPRAVIERVGFVGAGRIAALHGEALRRLPGVRITGILDLDADAARSLAARSGAEGCFTDPDRFYGQAAPQLVHVLTPPHTHAELALEALRRGAHVLLEKPAVLTVDDCDRLLDAARARNLTVGVDENFVHAPSTRRALAMIARGDLGSLVHVSTFLGFDIRRAPSSGASPGRSSWLASVPGGLLEDLLPHALSVTLAIGGSRLRPLHWSVISTGRLDCDLADEVRISLFDGELTGEVALSLTTRPDDFVVTIYGTRATLRIDLQNMLLDLARLGRGPKSLARGVRVVGSGLRMLTQTARNAARIAARLDLPPGTPLHLIRAHYEALAAGRELPAPLARARPIIEITRTLWPMPHSAVSDRRDQLTTGDGPASQPPLCSCRGPKGSVNEHHSGKSSGTQRDPTHK